MKKYGKIIGGLAALVLVVAVAFFAYNKLKSNVETPSGVGEVGKQDPAEEDSTSKEKEEAKQEDSGKARDQAEEGKDAEDPGADRKASEDVTFYDRDGNPVTLSSFYGKPVVVNFWATWCGYCKQEMPDFQEAYEEYKDRVEFLFVNATDGQRETKEKAEEYLKDKGYTVPAYYDQDQDAALTYSVSSLPTTMLLDKQGRVAAYAPGVVEKGTLTGALDQLLAE